MSEIAPLLAKIETLVWKGVFCQSSKWKELANALADSTPLKELNLGENRMDARAALNFSAVFKHLTQLETLKIASCAIGAEAIKNLGPEIGLCTSLSSLDIAKNRIGNEGARYLGDALMNCTRLKEITLQGNGISDSQILSVLLPPFRA